MPRVDRFEFYDGVRPQTNVEDTGRLPHARKEGAEEMTNEKNTAFRVSLMMNPISEYSTNWRYSATKLQAPTTYSYRGMKLKQLYAALPFRV